MPAGSQLDRSRSRSGLGRASAATMAALAAACLRARSCEWAFKPCCIPTRMQREASSTCDARRWVVAQRHRLRCPSVHGGNNSADAAAGCRGPAMACRCCRRYSHAAFSVRSLPWAALHPKPSAGLGTSPRVLVLARGHEARYQVQIVQSSQKIAADTGTYPESTFALRGAVSHPFPGELYRSHGHDSRSGEN